MLQRLSIRGKILAVVAVPILVLVMAAGVIAFGSVQDLNAARNAEELVDTLDRARTLQEDLQVERSIGADFVHTVTDSQRRLNASYGFTDSALIDLSARISESGADDPAAIQAQIDDAILRQGGSYMNAARSISTAPPSEGSDGWLVFPNEDEIATMQAGYASAVDAVNALAESLDPEYRLNVPLSALAFRLNAESELATALFTAPLEYQDGFDATTRQVDAAIESLGGSIEALGETEANSQAINALLAGQEAIANLEQTRSNARAADINPATLSTFYTDIIDTIVASANDVAVAMSDRVMVASIQAYGDLDALVENMKYERVTIDRYIRAGEFLPGEAAQARVMTTQTDLSLEDSQKSSAGISGADEVPPFGASASDAIADANSFNSVRTQVLTGLDSSLFAARTGDWATQVDEELAVYEPLREAMWDRIEARAGSNAQNALIATIITTIAIAAVVIISIVVALVIARRIIGPLRRLTTTATAVREELPRLVERVAIPGETVDVTEVQIPVESRDEIGRLAEAFNGVNAATLAIAGEQAALRGSISEMFVNVARRDQVLLNRQLASIDEMERTEDDPETLTKLFALDHLATRMRRNSESLLVLAGIDTGRRLRRPMPLSDVIRTASSEIEMYERVQLELDVDPQMLGHSALTTAHLIAELLENATVFSDPGTSVIVRTAERGADYVVEVEDAGIGMTEAELEAANNRVRSTAASEILGAQRLGLFVVGRIARRVGATVTIDSQEGSGTVATVTIPRSLFANDGAELGGHVSARVVDEAAHAPAALVNRSATDEIKDVPARSNVDAYTPTAVADGPSLSGRTGDGTATTDSSLDALIAADAASAPVAEPADPGALTDGSTAVGLPTRRRREPAGPADAEAEKRSIVGLPARATDAQLSALAQETTGFTPAVPAAEIAPQTPQERASVFRGFRSTREGEDGGPSTQEIPPVLGGQVPRQPALEQLDSDAAPLPTRTPGPVAPEVMPTRTSSVAGRDPGMAAAGAAGAAAFFARRARDEASGLDVGPTPPALAAREQAAPGVPSLAPESAPSQESAQSYESAQSHESAQSYDSAQSSAPAQSYESAQSFASAPSASSLPSFAAPTEATPAEPEAVEAAPADDLPVFRMPKLDSSVSSRLSERGGATSPAGLPLPARGFSEPSAQPWGESAQSAPSAVPALEDDAAAPSAPGFESSPFVVPALEQDDTDHDAGDVGGYPRTMDSSPTPYGGVEQVSVEADDTPVPAPAPASEFGEQPGLAQSPFEQAFSEAPAQDAPRYDAAPQQQYDAAPQQYDAEPLSPFEQAFSEAPAQDAPRYDAAPQQQYDAAPQQYDTAPGFGAAPAEQSPGAEQSVPSAPNAPWLATPAASAPTPAFAPEPTVDANVDALIQSAVDDDTERSPGFFSRLFGRGRRGDAAAAGAAATQWADVSDQQVAPASAPSAPLGFTPVSDLPPTPASWHSAPAPAQAPPARSVPSAPASAAPWEASPATIAPQPTVEHAPEPSVNDYQPTPLATSLHPPAPWEQDQVPSAPAPRSFAPPAPTEEPGHFSPDELAEATGWQAAGASALQAAQPEVATSYQPVIQPDLGGSGGGADLTSAVFSEFSSLAAERPKVEKTGAGLQRRRPTDAKPVEVKPIEETVSIAPAERDADAVRSRFSAFYSGTQRARSDAASFDHPSHVGEASDT